MANKVYKKVERCFNAGEVIFQQGDPPDGIYSVKMGRVSVYKTVPSPSGPVDAELVTLGPGGMFGEMGMLDGTPRDASVKALEYTECLVITSAMFETQMAALPPWVVNFIKILIARLRTTNEKLVAAQGALESQAPAAEQGPPADAPGQPAGAGTTPPGAETRPAGADAKPDVTGTRPGEAA